MHAGQWWSMSARAFQCWVTLYKHTLRSSIWTSVFGPLFYLWAIGFGLGTLVDRHGIAALGGVSYAEFLAPALLATSAMMTALNESTYPVFGALKWSKIYIAAQYSPLRPADIFRGHLLFIAMRLTINATIFTIFIGVFGVARSGWIVMAAPVAVLTGLVFAAPAAAWAMVVRSDNSFAYLLRFGITPLMLFSGTFFPISRLPEWLRLIAYAMPLWHGVALCRSLSLGQPEILGTLGHVVYLAAVLAVGLWAGSVTYGRRLYT